VTKTEKNQSLRSILSKGNFLELPFDKLKKYAKEFNKGNNLGYRNLKDIRIAIISSYLTDYLIEFLPLMFAQRGFKAKIVQGSFGSIASTILDKKSFIFKKKFDLILLLPTFRDLMFNSNMRDSKKKIILNIKKEVHFWKNLWKSLPAPAIQMGFDPPALSVGSEIAGIMPGSVHFHSRNVNMQLHKDMPSSITLIDAEQIINKIGIKNWHDPRTYHLCKQPFSFEAIPEISDTLAACSSVLLGRRKKVIVLDLDGTIWGNSVGDVGLEGIEIGPETPEGEAFTEFQEYLLNLKESGILLAVCSKNDRKIALEPFLKHPAMRIKKKDISCFVANFKDKASNLLTIAKELNLGTDSFVFVDDSPVERSWIRTKMPEVLVPEISNNPAEFPRTIDETKAFAISKITKEDLKRAKSYSMQAKIKKAISKTQDVQKFLSTLSPRAQIERVKPASLDRIQQIISRTNQFKLNPKIWTTKEILNNKKNVIAIHFRDKLQDYGIISVAIFSEERNTLSIKNWVMSCRVFSRNIELLMQELLIKQAKKSGLQKIELEYLQNKKNGFVKPLLAEIGYKITKNKNVWLFNVRSGAGGKPHNIILEK
jgi:FkbH-like protein